MEEVEVITKKSTMETLGILIGKYKFNIDVLSKLLNVKKEVILDKDEKKLFENFEDYVRITNLVLMLELIGKDDADFKIGAFCKFY